MIALQKKRILPHPMIKLRTIISGFLVAFSTFSLESCSHHDPLRPHQIPITSQLAKGEEKGDTSMIMAQSGIDFPVLLQAAEKGQPEAIRLLFWCSHNVGLDGAGADGYGSYLVEVGEKVGDQKVSEAIKGFDQDTLAAIEFHLLDACGFHNPNEEIRARAEPRLERLFPKSWRVIKANRP